MHNINEVLNCQRIILSSDNIDDVATAGLGMLISLVTLRDSVMQAHQKMLSDASPHELEVIDKYHSTIEGLYIANSMEVVNLLKDGLGDDRPLDPDNPT